MIAVGVDGEQVIILADGSVTTGGTMVRLTLTDADANDVVSQLVNLLEARARRKGTSMRGAVEGALYGAETILSGEDLLARAADPAEEARALDAAALAKRELEAKLEASREARRLRGMGGAK